MTGYHSQEDVESLDHVGRESMEYGMEGNDFGGPMKQMLIVLGKLVILLGTNTVHSIFFFTKVGIAK